MRHQGNRFAVYARYSTGNQSETSNDDQFRRCKEWVASEGGGVACTFADAAESGAKFRSRAGLQAMIAEARQPSCRFTHVIVDDLSRLSRDMLMGLDLVFRSFKRRNIVVVDRTTGQSSDEPSALIYFTALGLVGQLQRDAAKHQTHRGLTGRFHKGLSTGGRCYGYESVDGKRRVNDREAAVVRKIFELFEQGEGHRAIATRLNEEGIRAPYDGIRRKSGGEGWSHSTIAAMLQNERYVGVDVWNRRAFDRRSEAARESRIPRLRPEKELLRRDAPELRIIDDHLWVRVQGLRAERRARNGGAAAGKTSDPILCGGLLVCGLCGSHFGVVGKKTKAGVAYRQLGCSAYQSRGAAICANSRTVSEKRVSAALQKALVALLDDGQLFAVAEAAFSQALAQAAQTPAIPDVEQQRAALQLRRSHLLRLVEDGDAGAEARYRALGQQLAALQPGKRAAALPPRQLTAHFRTEVAALSEAIESDIRGANALLRLALPGKLQMIPESENPGLAYRVTGALEFRALAGTPEGPSCGGRI